MSSHHRCWVYPCFLSLLLSTYNTYFVLLLTFSWYFQILQNWFALVFRQFTRNILTVFSCLLFFLRSSMIKEKYKITATITTIAIAGTCSTHITIKKSVCLIVMNVCVCEAEIIKEMNAFRYSICCQGHVWCSYSTSKGIWRRAILMILISLNDHIRRQFWWN